jgi:DNA-directed RNA polymerase specialized sigma24 family protein
VASPTDQQLIQFIQQGRPEAVAQLFDRYSSDLYDFLARLIGDRDQAARLLEEIFMRVPGAVAGFPARESVRGGLYSLAREAGLNWLRQKNSLDSLPTPDEPAQPGLGGDIWKAARTMPAFHRAVLILEELHALSPTEKARALGVQRTDLPRLVDEARSSFTRAFDAQARVEGRPTTAQIDPERILGLRRRISTPGTSLFSFLPPLVMPDSLQLALRQRIIQAVRGMPLRPVEPLARPGQAEEEPAKPALGAAASQIEPPPPYNESGGIPFEPEPEPQAFTASPPPGSVVSGPPIAREAAPSGFFGNRLPAAALAALIGVVLALLICSLIYFFFVVNVPSPVIDALQPPDGASVPQTTSVKVSLSFHDPRSIDTLRSKLSVDGVDVSALSVITDTGMMFSAPLGIGPHSVRASIFNVSGKQTDKNWSFNVVPGLTPTPTETPIIPTSASIPTETPTPTLTPSETPTPTSSPPPPSPTPCLVGITGVTFNDFNLNGAQDPGEPNLPGISVALQDSSGATLVTAITDAFGNYQFVNLAQGTYVVRAGRPADFISTTPTIVTVNLFGCGPFIGLDFGMTPIPPPPPPPPPQPTHTLIPTIAATQTPIIIIVTPTATNTPIPSITPVPTSTFTPSPPPPTSTSTPITPAFQVTNVTAVVAPTSSTNCNQTFNFSGSITVNSAGTVQYQWVKSTGSSGPIQGLTFLSAGTQNVAPDSWAFAAVGPFNYSGWERLDVIAPAPTPTPQPTPSGSPSNQANFTLFCP